MRRLMVVLVVAVLGANGSVAAQPSLSAELEEDIRTLLSVTGSENLAVLMMSQMIGTMKQAMPEVPDDFWSRFMNQADTGELVDLIVPIYARHFTHNEIKQILIFYQTPIGQKLISVTPTLTQESMIAGQKWGEQLGLRIAEQMAAEGYSGKGK